MPTKSNYYQVAEPKFIILQKLIE